MTILIAGCVLSSFAVSCAATAAMRRIARRCGLIDQPNAARKVHTTPTPLGGGIAIWVGIVVPLLAAHVVVWWIKSASVPDWFPADLAKHLEGVVFKSQQLWAIVGGGTVMSILGLIDDKVTLRWQPKLLVQFLVAAGLVAAGVRATVFMQAEWVGIALSVLWIVVLTNAFNFLDNMDGLSSGIGLIASVMFAVVMLTATSEPRWFVAAVLLILSGSLAGFLVHNWPPAKIFMGDSGSCLIGMLLASLTIVGTFFEYGKSSGKHVLLAPLCILAVPLYDFCSVVFIRLRQGRSPFHADKQHFSHRLVELGLSRPKAVLTIYLVTMTTGLGALLLYQVTSWTAAFLVLALIGCTLAVIAILETVGRRKNR
jgi:UDP-GlcNAc:undecaprenyl-phosphate GlcNAc-1-phosphate transferase